MEHTQFLNQRKYFWNQNYLNVKKSFQLKIFDRISLIYKECLSCINNSMIYLVKIENRKFRSFTTEVKVISHLKVFYLKKWSQRNKTFLTIDRKTEMRRPPFPEIWNLLLRKKSSEIENCVLCSIYFY